MTETKLTNYVYSTICEAVLAFLSSVGEGRPFFATELFKEVREAMYPRKPFEKSIYNAMNKLKRRGIIKYELVDQNKGHYWLLWVERTNSSKPRVKELTLW